MTKESAVAIRPPEIRLDGPALPLKPNPNFNSPQWARLERDKIISVSSRHPGFSSVILLETQSPQSSVPVTELIQKTITEIPPRIEEVKKELAYNPSKKSREYIDHRGRHILIHRSRRGSRCLAQPDHEPRDCQGRRHLKKSKSAQVEQMSSGNLNIENTSKKRKVSRSTRQEVMLNGKKIK